MSSESSNPKAQLIELLRQRSFKVGDFVLASGRRSSYYVDARMTTMSAAGLDLVGRLGHAEIVAAGWEAVAVGGLTLGADPVAYAIARASLGTPHPLDAFTVRKEPKAHGRGRQIEGCFPDGGGSVIVVEDVITTGGSALKAAAAVETGGGTISGIIAVVDRNEGGKEHIEAAGYQVRALVDLHDLAGA